MTDDEVLALEGKRVRVTCTNGFVAVGYIDMEPSSYDEACVYCGRDGILGLTLDEIASVEVLEG